MKELRTEIKINASADIVWKILTDLKAYSEWNPFIKHIEGTVSEGERLVARIEPPGGKPMTFKPVVLKAVHAKEFRWLGHLLMPGIFDGQHIFEIEEIGPKQVRLIHREEFRGLLVPLLWKSLDTKARLGFEAMNNALKERAESILATSYV